MRHRWGSLDAEICFKTLARSRPRTKKMTVAAGKMRRSSLRKMPRARPEPRQGHNFTCIFRADTDTQDSFSVGAGT